MSRAICAVLDIWCLRVDNTSDKLLYVQLKQGNRQTELVKLGVKIVVERYHSN